MSELQLVRALFLAQYTCFCVHKHNQFSHSVIHQNQVPLGIIISNYLINLNIAEILYFISDSHFKNGKVYNNLVTVGDTSLILAKDIWYSVYGGGNMIK